MLSIERELHIEGPSASHTAAGNVVRGQQSQSPASSSPSSFSAVRIEQATISTSQQFTIATKAMETGHTTMSTAASETVASAQKKHGLSSKSIVGLAMIPVAVLLLTIAVFTYFWMRKRRRKSAVLCRLNPSSRAPAVPKKDFGSPTSSFESAASGGRVRNMAAMSTPIAHTGWIAASHPRVQTLNDSAVHYNPWTEQLPKISADITTAGLHVPGEAFESGNDSPIDRSSPFRLKRGDTRKRSSLDPDVMSAWPAPPQPATQPAPQQSSRAGKVYMERRSISAEYFAQERDCYDARGTPSYWQDARLELGPDPGPTFRTH